MLTDTPTTTRLAEALARSNTFETNGRKVTLGFATQEDRDAFTEAHIASIQERLREMGR